MTREEATKEATEVAKENGITMVVAFNPYSDEESPEEAYGYYPEHATSIFTHEQVVETIYP